MAGKTPRHLDFDMVGVEDIIAEADIEPPPQDILDEIDMELDPEEDDSASGLGDILPRKKAEPTYEGDMTRYAMTTLRKFVYVKNEYLAKTKEARRQAQLRVKSARSCGKIGRLTNDITYLTERARIQSEFQLQIETLSALLLKPRQFQDREKPLTATKVHTLSVAYEALMFTEGFLPFNPDKNKYLMRVRKTVHEKSSTSKICKVDRNWEGRFVLAAGLAMINYYFGQKIEMPYTVHLFEGNDAIRVAGVIAKYVIERGVAEYSTLENQVRWFWPEVVFSLYHFNLPKKDKPYMKFLLSHMLARLVFTDVIEGHIKPIREGGTYRDGLYFTANPKYLKQKSL